MHSIRGYPAVADIRQMVSRTAYAQLRYSPLLLAGTVLGLALTYLAPVAFALFAGRAPAQFLGMAAWLLMAVAFQPMLRLLPPVPAVGPGVAGDCGDLYGVHHRFRLSACARARRHVEGPRAGQYFGIAMNEITSATRALASGKGHRKENFPVASWLIDRRHRPAILAFYNFVRMADDIADHATLPAARGLLCSIAWKPGSSGKSADDAAAARLRAQLAERNLSTKHAQDLLAAFKLDVTKLRYRDWDELIGYCSLSAMPVGRFVCDVHGKSRAIWPANDALCAALQIINHLQDCRTTIRSSIAAMSAGRPRRRRRQRRSVGRPAPRRRCSAACIGLRNGPSELLAVSRPFASRSKMPPGL